MQKAVELGAGWSGWEGEGLAVGADGCAGTRDTGQETARPPPQISSQELGKHWVGAQWGGRSRGQSGTPVWDCWGTPPPQVGLSLEQGTLGSGAPGQDQVSPPRTRWESWANPRSSVGPSGRLSLKWKDKNSLSWVA